MPILNYTTTVDAFKTVSEIEYILMRHGANAILKDYDNGRLVGLSFLIDRGNQQIPIRLPAKIEQCFEIRLNG